ncbi:MAG: alpha/beta fold hydrolase [Alphaproteobacteria bacterium]|nr:alpha/beta fold hydrolase [Alphaproteobacteria bacterium]MCB9927853.1 alpha/beta fold hydrolase [Alphaproteobacteria bacterium]
MSDYTPNPVALAFDEAGNGPPLLILHGLLGQARNWASQMKRFAADYRVLVVDLRNHGRSPWAEGMTYEAMADDIAALAERIGPPVRIVGHSMGGKVTMVTALKYPHLVERPVVVDISPVRHEQTPFYDYLDAMLGLDLSAIARRGQADRLLADAIPSDAERAFLLLNLAADGGQGLRWRPNLRELRDRLPDILDWPEFLFRYRYPEPILFVAGGDSPYIQDSHKAAIARLFPQAEYATIPGAGHWVHADQPQAFFDTVSAFLNR